MSASGVATTAARWLGRLVGVLVLGLVLGSVVVLMVLPRAVHAQALTVLTGSMTPAIPVGSAVLVRPVDPGTLHVGDVATYQPPGKSEYITHRIVKIDASKSPTVFTFKGDANRGPDIWPVPANAIHGKVWFHVPYLGAIRDALHTRNGLAGAGMVLLAGYALVQFTSVFRDRRRDQRPAAGSTTAEVVPFPAAPRYEAVIRATFFVETLEGLTPELFAALLRAALEPADRGPQTCTLVLAVAATRVRDTVALLEKFEPTTLDICGTDAAPVDWSAMDLHPAGALSA